MDEKNNISIWKMMITFDNIWKKQQHLFNLKDDDNILHLKDDDNIFSIRKIMEIFFPDQRMKNLSKLKNEEIFLN